MKAAVCNRPGELKLIDKPAPTLSRGHAIVRIQRAGICGTDIHAFKGVQPYFTYPRILGHELSGELIDADDLTGINAGEKVTLLPYWSCGTCIACRTGKPNCCVQMQVCGVHVDGGMVQYLSVPSRFLLNGAGLLLDELALVEPLAIGAHAVSRAGIREGEVALVIGAGPIGLGIAQFCQLSGAKVIVMDVDEKRLQYCRDVIRVADVINPAKCDAIAEIRSATNNDMATAVFDATGNLQAINGALVYLAHGGRYVLVGLQKGDLQFSHPEFHKRETTLMSSRNALREDFEYVVDCIRNKRFDPKKLITHRLSFLGLETEFEQLIQSTDLVVKGIIDFDQPTVTLL